MVEVEVELSGVVYGPIWWPTGQICSMPVRLRERDFLFSDGSRPSARDFCEHATSPGNFQSCELTRDSMFVFTRWSQRGDDMIRRQRFVEVTKFPSVADYIGDKDQCEVTPNEEA